MEHGLVSAPPQTPPEKLGETQLERMLSDRPEMRPFITRGDAVWNWCVKQFAGGDTKIPIDWSSVPPMEPNVESESGPGDLSHHGEISVRRIATIGLHTDSPRYGEDMWGNVIFELCNAQLYREHKAVSQWAYTAHPSKQEYIRRSAYVEYLAAVRTKRFYDSLWKPNMDRLGIHSRPYNLCWNVGISDQFDEWLRNVDTSGYAKDFEADVNFR
ncbi:MAG: hypothetical protein NT023_25635 [Armatimonadetes bacterium]|nr:hypothetical protein [Armatimonadota bacterium]